MNADDRKALFGDKAKLSKFVHNHVITKELAAKDMVDGMKLTTMDSQVKSSA
jgi:hypothetical protein